MLRPIPSSPPGPVAPTPARAFAALWLAVLVLLSAPAPAAAADTGYEAPVAGEVVTAFEPPPERWEAGHRGVDLAADRGGTVRAAGAGDISFAGSVAGARWVTITHPDGVRTSYGPLDEVRVTVGESVGAGAGIGTVAPGHLPGRTVLHWGARRGEEYLDPLTLLRPDRWAPALVGQGTHRFTDEPAPRGYGGWDGRRGLSGRLGLVTGSPVADRPGWSLAPNPNHVIALAGFGSDTGTIPMDVAWLGYDPGDVTYLSYAGRAERAVDPRDPRRDQLPYDPVDTWQGVHAAALRLREQLRAQWARSPGQAVDLVGHSMGGLVVSYYLLRLHDPADPTLPPIGHVATLAAPLEGSDLANALRSASGSQLMDVVIRGGARLFGRPLPGREAQAARDLTVGSEVVGAVGEGWARARADHYAGPLGGGTDLMTVGGSRDLVVPEHRTELPGSHHVVVPGGHDRMRRTEAGYEVVRSFLADDPVPGSSGGLGHAISHLVGVGQRAAGREIGQAGRAAESYLAGRVVRGAGTLLR